MQHSSNREVGRTVGPYFANRVNEYHQLRSEIEELVPEVEPLQHVPGEKNISADMCTRGRAAVDDIGPGSTWQEGPGFLKLERDQWPLSRDFENGNLPKEELRSKHEVLFYKIKTPRYRKATKTFREMVTLNLEHHSSWMKSQGVLA